MSLKHDSFKKVRKEKNKWRLNTPEDFEEMEDTFLKERMQSKEPTITTTVRITAGKAKNFNLEVPKATRPMTDRMKIRIFDILSCLLYTSDAADDLLCVDLGGRRITKKKTQVTVPRHV